MGGLRGRICLYPQIHDENQAEPVSRLGIKPSHARQAEPRASSDSEGGWADGPSRVRAYAK